MLSLLRSMGLDWDVHGFRTSFGTFVLDNKKQVLDVDAKELALDHAIGNSVAGSYRDTGLLIGRLNLALGT
jgi:hypothetical protein